VTDSFEPFDEGPEDADPFAGVPDTEGDAETLLRRAVDSVNVARAMPLSSSVLVARDELLALLEAALDRLPDELRQARWLLRESDEFVAQRKRDADSLLDDVRAQAERMVQRTEIVRQANQVAQRILDDAREDARRLRHEAEDFCDQKLASFEIVLDRTLKTVLAGREKLQATPVVVPPDGAEVEATDPPGSFFDQDEGEA
jgi:F0F1-type ATP synthase membrane subunit b/b'